MRSSGEALRVEVCAFRRTWVGISCLRVTYLSSLLQPNHRFLIMLRLRWGALALPGEKECGFLLGMEGCECVWEGGGGWGGRCRTNYSERILAFSELSGSAIATTAVTSSLLTLLCWKSNALDPHFWAVNGAADGGLWCTVYVQYCPMYRMLLMLLAGWLDGKLYREM